jgi:hypothetical protein
MQSCLQMSGIIYGETFRCDRTLATRLFASMPVRNCTTERRTSGQKSLASVLQYVRIARIPQRRRACRVRHTIYSSKQETESLPSFSWSETAPGNTLLLLKTRIRSTDNKGDTRIDFLIFKHTLAYRAVFELPVATWSVEYNANTSQHQPTT